MLLFEFEFVTKRWRSVSAEALAISQALGLLHGAGLTIHLEVSFSAGGDMKEKTKIGIIICDRYRTCAGGKCFRSLRNREGAFSRYKNREVEIVGYTSCDGCPGGNVEYAVEEMLGNGAQVIHLATGLVVGYPPCPHIVYFRDYIKTKYGLEVVYGTHPIPQKYLTMHDQLGTWDSPEWQEIIQPTLVDEETRLSYD
jgi:predicted metal-binding protein